MPPAFRILKTELYNALIVNVKTEGVTPINACLIELSKKHLEVIRSRVTVWLAVQEYDPALRTMTFQAAQENVIFFSMNVKEQLSKAQQQLWKSDGQVLMKASEALALTHEEQAPPLRKMSQVIGVDYTSWSGSDWHLGQKPDERIHVSTPPLRDALLIGHLFLQKPA